MKHAFVIVCAILCGCTYNISMAHTQGSAVDVIDDAATNTPTVTANIPIPGV